MYKVLKPLPGYGYCIGDETKYISDEDAKKFLQQKKIEMASVEAEPDPEWEALAEKYFALTGKKAKANMKLENLQAKVTELEAK